ncbi:MAG: D-alanyl-D-alanine carboxypeptidase [Holosporaceae bacterium]|jgi:D-alanyl-D-alanine carboxypeptidase (penicillin-binding protein 5/6)|nr:D-alanyl-D-alanine carboxypeptidase [Holosporaceae bacterium]
MNKVALTIILSLSLSFAPQIDAAKKKVPKSKISRLVIGETKKNGIKKGEEQESGARQKLLVDFDTGDRLFEKSADERCAPSSMTKLMTIYLLFEAIENGSLKLTDELPVSEAAQSKEGSRSFFKAGTLAKVEDLIRSIIVNSGNDACTIVAEKISGDEEAFAGFMNEKAAIFGLKNTHFKNASGLPDNEHYSCASDLVTMAQRLLKDFPQHYHYFSEKGFEVNGIFQKNRNVLLGNNLNVDGLKTGETSAGGAGMVVSAKKNGKRLIGMVNGCKNARERAHEANKLMAMGYGEYIPLKLATAYAAIGYAAVSVGKSDYVEVCTQEDISIFILKKYKNDVVVERALVGFAEAPVISGTKLGTMVFKYGNVVSKKYDLFARETVERLTFWERIGAFFLNLFGSGKSKNSAKNSGKKKLRGGSGGSSRNADSSGNGNSSSGNGNSSSGNGNSGNSSHNNGSDGDSDGHPS